MMKKLLLFLAATSVSSNASAWHPITVSRDCISQELRAGSKVEKFEGLNLRRIEELALDVAWNGRNKKGQAFLKKVGVIINAMTSDKKERDNLMEYVTLIMGQVTHYRFSKNN